MRTLYWLTHDIRLDDNPALRRAANSDSLVIVYYADPRWFRANRYQLSSMGGHRWQFMRAALDELAASLAQLGQKLLVRHACPEQDLPELIRDHQIERLVCARQFGCDEIRSLRAVLDSAPALTLDSVDSYTLFTQEQLPFAAGEIPATYSRFRRQVEKLAIDAPLASPEWLPPPPLSVANSEPGMIICGALPEAGASDSEFQGGEQAAHAHLDAYMASTLPHAYKKVRNALDGWDNSTKMSPWLNSGCLSPRRLQASLTDYEAQNGRNDSSYWIYVELLWREYFQWLALDTGVRLFSLQGTAKRRPLSCFFPDRYQMWCAGSTPFPLVNACMHQLRETGYLSNRGRQIAASCFINELNLDWRYGAAWFEHQLVDYNVGSNWGNWQYIAGVGADPRGGRHFNLAKQTEQFDADGSYRARWGGDDEVLPLDSRDAADWPIDPGKRS